MFMNLAGWEYARADPWIETELKRCEIPSVRAPIPHPHPEVHTHLTGLLGGVAFRRAWRYWCVDCWVPYAVALKMYETVVGAQDIRISGHCACPPPIDWCTWVNVATGRRVIKTDEKTRAEEWINKPDGTDLMKRVGERLLVDFDFADNPAESTNFNGFIDSYHIDTELGLYQFVQTIKANDCLGEKPFKD